MKHIASVLILLCAMVSPAQASSMLGLWAAEPDGKGQVGHIEIRPCGPAFCGTILRAFDAAGKPVVTENVGRQILRGFTQTGANTYGNGMAYVPLLRQEFKASAALNGNTLKITACNAVAICRTQTWKRVK